MARRLYGTCSASGCRGPCASWICFTYWNDCGKWPTCFTAKEAAEAEQFVTRHLGLLLKGKVGYVIGRFKRLREEHTLRGSRRRTVSAVIGYYENNRRHMRYDEYLAAGYPIGSGVAEGACRHVVKDRLEQTGMRWTSQEPRPCCTCGPSTSMAIGTAS